MFPSPMMPSVRPVTPWPMWSSFSAQRPARVRRSLTSSLWVSASRSVSTAAATGRRTPSGVMVSNTSRSVQAGTSTLS